MNLAAGLAVATTAALMDVRLGLINLRPLRRRPKSTAVPRRPISLGNFLRPDSPQVAQQSYLLVTEDDFAKAAGMARVMVEG